MPAYNVKSRFADDVEDGRKLHTIRPRRKRPTRRGDTLFLYTGQRTKKCRLLRKTVCTNVRTVEIYNDEVWIEQECLTGDALEEFALADGFKSTDDFFNFFRKTYHLSESNPLTEMELVKWE